MQVDRENACQDLNCPCGGGTKGSCDPSTSVHLHGPEFLHGALKLAVLIVPQLRPIHCDWKDVCMVEELLVLEAESLDRVIQEHHCLHCGEGLGGILLQMLPEQERSIKEEVQIPPEGTRIER